MYFLLFLFTFRAACGTACIDINDTEDVAAANQSDFPEMDIDTASVHSELQKIVQSIDDSRPNSRADSIPNSQASSRVRQFTLFNFICWTWV